MTQNLKKRLLKIWTKIAKAFIISIKVTAFKKLILLLFFVALTISLVSTKVDNANPFTNPSGWHINREGQFIVSNPIYEHTAGNPSLSLNATDPDGNNPDREYNSAIIPVNAGQHIVYSCWIKITESGLDENRPWLGARIGIDFFDSHRIIALQSSTWAGQNSYLYPEIPNWSDLSEQAVWNNFVNWGTVGWQKRTIDFIVPSSMPSDGRYYPLGETHSPTAMIVWMQVGDSSDPGQAWFADSELYIDSIAIPLEYIIS